MGAAASLPENICICLTNVLTIFQAAFKKNMDSILDYSPSCQFRGPLMRKTAVSLGLRQMRSMVRV